jgi:hypothetical protein
MTKKYKKLGFKTYKEYKDFKDRLSQKARKITLQDRLFISQKTGLNIRDIHTHHIIPISEGGNNNISNLYICSKKFHYKTFHPEFWDFKKNTYIFGNPRYLINHISHKNEKHPRWVDIDNYKEEIIKLNKEGFSTIKIIDKLNLSVTKDILHKRYKYWGIKSNYSASLNTVGKNNNNYNHELENYKNFIIKNYYKLTWDEIIDKLPFSVTKPTLKIRAKKWGLPKKPMMGKLKPGLFGIKGVYLNKEKRFNNKPWYTMVSFKGKSKNLGVFHEFISPEIVHDIVREEVLKESVI